MQLLHIDSAITGAQSVSRQLTTQVTAAWVAAHPGTWWPMPRPTSPWTPWRRAPARPKA